MRMVIIFSGRWLGTLLSHVFAPMYTRHDGHRAKLSFMSLSPDGRYSLGQVRGGERAIMISSELSGSLMTSFMMDREILINNLLVRPAGVGYRAVGSNGVVIYTLNTLLCTCLI